MLTDQIARSIAPSINFKFRNMFMNLERARHRSFMRRFHFSSRRNELAEVVFNAVPAAEALSTLDRHAQIATFLNPEVKSDPDYVGAFEALNANFQSSISPEAFCEELDSALESFDASVADFEYVPDAWLIDAENEILAAQEGIFDRFLPKNDNALKNNKRPNMKNVDPESLKVYEEKYRPAMRILVDKIAYEIKTLVLQKSKDPTTGPIWNQITIAADSYAYGAYIIAVLKETDVAMAGFPADGKAIYNVWAEIAKVAKKHQKEAQAIYPKCEIMDAYQTTSRAYGLELRLNHPKIDPYYNRIEPGLEGGLHCDF